MNQQNYTPTKWETIEWREVKARVYEEQTKIYKLSQNGSTKTMHELQQRLLSNVDAKLLATRRVTQENKGRKTPGIDGIAAISPSKRFNMALRLELDGKASHIRRVWIDKPGNKEKRPLGIPTLLDRAKQALALLALEPEWEARFSENSYGFRPGRGIRDAHKQIKNILVISRKWIYDADIEKCFDRINHNALLTKLSQDDKSTISVQVATWLRAGVLEGGITRQNEQGTPQGGVISPLLANIAMHGLENEVLRAVKTSGLKSAAKLAARTKILVYADDFLILAPSEETLKAGIGGAEHFLQSMGLNLNHKKSRITHSSSGFEYLGCTIKQQEVGKKKRPSRHNTVNITWRLKILPTQENVDKHFREIRKQAKSCGDTKTLIRKLNPIIEGFKQFALYTDAGTYGKASLWSTQLYRITSNWLSKRYKVWGKDLRFYTRHRDREWVVYARDGNKKHFLETYYRKGDAYGLNKHIKVRGNKSPYDGDWKYWGTRTTANSEISDRKLTLLKKQRGRCAICYGSFTPNDTIQLDHIAPRSCGGSESLRNLQLLHQECHEQKSAEEKRKANL